MSRTEEDNLKVISDIKEKHKEGKIIVMTEDGPAVMALEDFVKQPADGMLYDLNRDEATIMTLGKTSKNLRFVNDLAVCYTIKHLKKLIELKDAEIDNLRNQLNEANKELRETQEEFGKYSKDPFYGIDAEKELTKQMNKEFEEKILKPAFKKSLDKITKVKPSDIVVGFNDSLEINM